MLLELLKNTNNGNKKSSKIYVGGCDNSFKIGMTQQDRLAKRVSVIRQTDKNFTVYKYIEFEGSKAFTELIESMLRSHLEGLGFKNFGNDHFIKKGRKDVFTKKAIEFVAIALTDLGIDFEVKTYKGR